MSHVLKFPADDSIEFSASIPAIDSAIKFHGDAGARLMLDVAENNMGAFVRILTMRGKRLRVKIISEGDGAGEWVKE